MLTVNDLVLAMERIAPRELAEAWDNTGLLVGDASAALVGPVLLTIDLNEEVMTEAIGAMEAPFGAIVAYHPPIFTPCREITAATSKGRTLLRAIQADIAIYSPHTALDAAEGGVADWLISLAGAGTERVALTAAAQIESSQALKVVAFVPTKSLDAVRSAMAAAGAGQIGAYEQCSFGVAGKGSFFGTSATNPAVGAKGKLEFVEETRIEMVASHRALPAIIAALRSAHPYEEPAFDVYPLAAKPRADFGPGRAMTLTKPATVSDIARKITKALGLEGVQVAEAAGDAKKKISRVAVCPGSGESLISAALAQGAELFITGEMKHHEVLRAVDEGLSVILAGHTETERGYLSVLAQKLSDIDPRFAPLVSAMDAAPLRFTR